MGLKKPSARKAHGGVRLHKLPTGAETSSSAPPRHVVAELETPMAYTGIPIEVLTAKSHTLDLSRWSIVARDGCLQKLSALYEPADAASNQLSDLLAARRTPLHSLNLAGAEHVTDQGAVWLGRACPELTELNLERAVNLTDVGVRHLVSSCRKLQSLHLNFVTGLRGPGVSSIGDCQLPLRALSVAGCTKVPDFALQRVFQCCPALERLDLSFCGTVTDQLLLALGKSCPKLTQLKLRGCRQISDSGVVAVANACAGDLTVLDLARFDLQYKLNDVALLALGEKCHVLQTVILSGCDMLTDVGISWLTSGCPAITHLDVSDCTKITDISLRAMGEHLLQLQHLNVAHCARISDQGVRYLAQGCPDLAHFVATGLVLLSNAHAQEPGAILQGIPALAVLCTRLRHLDISGCTSIGDATLRSLAHKDSALSVLIVNGCPRVTTAGVQAVFSHCRALSAIHLNDCVTVTDQAFFSHAATHSGVHSSNALPAAPAHAVSALPTSVMYVHLTILRVRHCALLTNEFLKRVCHAGLALQELDVSGCVKITDMGILSLMDSATASSLRYLWLRDLSELTQTGLSWLSEACSKLLLLDLTGCSKIRSFSIKSLASCWKFAVFQHNDQFKGMVPRHRAEHLLFIDEYGACWQAAIRIQCLYRARVARRIARAKREQQLIMWVARRLQSICRGRQARKLFIIKRMQFQKETQAATRIQSIFRQRKAKQLLELQRRMNLEQTRQSAARRIQAAYRRKRLWERLGIRAKRQRALFERRRQAALVIQRHWRGKRSRNQTSVLFAVKRARDREEAEAANKMQNLFRVRAARREANEKHDALRALQAQQERAALTLQAHIRRRHAYKEIQRRKQNDQKRNDAARRIQRHWRDKKRWRVNQLVLFARERKQQYDAAVKLQAAWKRRQGKLAAKLLRLIRDQAKQQMLEAALKVQTNWRGKRGRQQAAREKQAIMEKIVQELRMHNHAATLVQAHFRGRRGRAQYRKMILLKKQRWKEICHVEDGVQKRFYYNKVTGEVRFRRPQDVLDLLPKPACDNCPDSPATVAHVECQDCGEMYCKTCWQHIHAGGKRKQHEFRALYDFYDRRVDYGDGEFPSKWPSEIEQDEKDGWALRMFPRRKPVDVQGFWEQYQDPQTGQEWFYNKETGEDTYIRPHAFLSSNKDNGEGNDAWTKYYDDTQMVEYYFNAATQESTYTRPAGYITPRMDRNIAMASKDQSIPSARDGWKKFLDAQSGYPYYYNEATMESTYTRPMGFETARIEASASSVQSEWARYYDQAQGTYYYYNSRTMESSVTRPSGSFVTPRITVEAAAALQCQSFVDPATSKMYYFNPQTTECRQAQNAKGVRANYR